MWCWVISGVGRGIKQKNMEATEVLGLKVER